MAALKLKRIRYQGHTLVRCKVGKLNTFDTMLAHKLLHGSIPGALPFSYSENKPGDYRLFYQVTATTPLSVVLGANLTGAQTYYIFTRIIALLDTCNNAKFPTQNIVYDPQWVFMHPQTLEPQFIILPFMDYKQADKTILDLLVYIAQAARPANALEQRQLTHMIEWFKTSHLFSLLAFKEYLGIQPGSIPGA